MPSPAALPSLSLGSAPRAPCCPCLRPGAPRPHPSSLPLPGARPEGQVQLGQAGRAGRRGARLSRRTGEGQPTLCPRQLPGSFPVPGTPRPLRPVRGLQTVPKFQKVREKVITMAETPPGPWSPPRAPLSLQLGNLMCSKNYGRAQVQCGLLG